METKANIIRRYADAAPESKVDIVCRHYPQIDGIINARIAGMKYIIWEEKEKNRRADHGELGIRIQSGDINEARVLREMKEIRNLYDMQVAEILNATSCQRGTKSFWHQMTESRRD